MSNVPSNNPPPGGGGYAPPPGGGYVSPPPAAAAGGQTNVLAIIGLVVGILSIVFFCVPPLAIILGIAAAILGFVARSQIAQRGQSGAGLAMAALILGIIGLILGIILTILALTAGSVLTTVINDAAATLTATAP